MLHARSDGAQAGPLMMWLLLPFFQSTPTALLAGCLPPQQCVHNPHPEKEGLHAGGWHSARCHLRAAGRGCERGTRLRHAPS